MKNTSSLSPEEAKEALAIAIADSSAENLKTSTYREVGTYILIWGAVYTLVPLSILFYPKQADWLANSIVAIGVILTVVLWSRTPVKSDLGLRLGFFWWISAAFAVAWMIILGGENFPNVQVNLEGRQTWAFCVTVAMFLWVLMGLIAHLKLLIWLGIGISAFTLAAFFVAWEWKTFWTWMILFNGAPLLISGLYCKLNTPSIKIANA